MHARVRVYTVRGILRYDDTCFTRGANIDMILHLPCNVLTQAIRKRLLVYTTFHIFDAINCVRTYPDVPGVLYRRLHGQRWAAALNGRWAHLVPTDCCTYWSICNFTHVSLMWGTVCCSALRVRIRVLLSDHIEEPLPTRCLLAYNISYIDTCRSDSVTCDQRG